MLDIPLNLRANLGRPLTSAELDYNFKFLEALYTSYPLQSEIDYRLGLIESMKLILDGGTLTTEIYDAILRKNSRGLYLGIAPDPVAGQVIVDLSADLMGKWASELELPYYLVPIPAGSSFKLTTGNSINGFPSWSHYEIFTNLFNVKNGLLSSMAGSAEPVQVPDNMFMLVSANSYSITIDLEA